MMDSYKNTERLRYRINQDLTEIVDNVEKRNIEQHNIFVDECFSAIASTLAALFLTQSTFEPLKNGFQKILLLFIDDKVASILSIIITVLLSLFIMIIASIGINKALVTIKRRKQEKGAEGRDTKNYIKEFDNIACDSILVSLQYMTIFAELTNLNEQTLYYLEIMHYLEVACETTEKLCDDRKNIRSAGNIFGVYSYRVNNVLKIMNELIAFLKQEVNCIALTNDEKEQIKSQLGNIDIRIQRIIA